MFGGDFFAIFFAGLGAVSPPFFKPQKAPFYPFRPMAVLWAALWAVK